VNLVATMSNMQDPFYVVKEEVNEALQAVGEIYDKWKDLLENSNTAMNDEFKWVSNELRTGLRGIESDLGDLEETISVVERDKTRFRIDDYEINNRKSFVIATKKRFQSIKDDMGSIKTKGKMEKDSRLVLIPTKNEGKFSKYEEAIRQDNEDFIQDQHAKQQMIFERQDKGLDKLGESVGKIKTIASTIGNELEEQNKLIGDIEHETDKAESGLKNAVRKVNNLLDSTKDGTQIGIIVFLILLLVGLVVLVFYI